MATRSGVRRTPRVTAVVLAATVAVLAPGVPVSPAGAQETGSAVTPPPVNPGMYPGNGGVRPDKAYVKKIECVTRRELDENVVLPNKPWGQQYLRVEELHKLTRSATGSAGGGVKVAVIDTGVTPHPFFQGRVEPGGDYVAEVAPGAGLEDCDGHGTEVAGIIAANPRDPNIGFVGVAPDATIVSIRQSSQNYGPPDENQAQPPAQDEPGQPGGEQQPENPPEGGSGDQPNALRGSGGAGTGPAQNGPTRQLNKEDAAGNLTTLAYAVARATEIEGVRVINISINNCRDAALPMNEGEARLQAAVHHAVERDIVVVAAAGNTSESCKQNDQLDPSKPRSIVTPPWFANDVLSVAAIDETGSVADFSVNGPWVSVAAPGTNIISLDPAKNSNLLANRMVEGNGEPMPIQGTSFAAPYVSGVVALVRAKYPHLSARQVMHRITSTAQHPGGREGRDNFTGYGVINPMAALTATIPSEEGVPPARPERMPSDMPPWHEGSDVPLIVAFAGAGGALVALFVTLFVVHTIRRNRREPTTPRRGTV
ncbi:membrane-anchored mycosin MYCP [Amycolatopsis arida]|uniref:Membrane-anchored mycosin MYCP n=1 Tax=Amycolatopsis arida TaxID=587909 RepID=A0A1I6A1S0_9PSEU|nr:type VII secretion-associated serine protease mycosin [Amycolatopsis arida]TDX88688.1 membrane-anchored mycosin MYCP [Amycolatopsis arida]SFQ62659.1 membrane-anchored mycosin MYCP [Amycolatopsis arida]